MKTLSFIIFFFSYCNLTFAQIGQWTSLENGLDSTVHAIKVVATTKTLYVGGQFRFSGTDTLNHIAKWENGKWHALNDGLNDWVGAIEFYKNEIYVGGAFTKANGIQGQGNKIAKWNGNEWLSVGDSLGGGANGNITSLCVFNNTLIVGGYFTSIGKIKANHIAMWDGKEWMPLGEGVNGVVYSIKKYKNMLYVGGHFSKAGNESANSIAIWNGKLWKPLKNGITYKSGAYVFAMEVYRRKLYVGGSFDKAGNTSSNNLAIWTSKRWKPTKMNLSNPSDIYCIKKYKKVMLLAVSSFGESGAEPNFIRVMQRNRLKKVIGSLSNNILCMELTGDTLFVGGHFKTINLDEKFNRIAQYNLTGK